MVTSAHDATPQLCVGQDDRGLKRSGRGQSGVQRAKPATSPGTLEAIYEFMVGKVDKAKLQFRRPKRLPAVSERSEHYSTLLVSGMRCLHSAAHRCL